jgi:hypothetical protein
MFDLSESSANTIYHVASVLIVAGALIGLLGAFGATWAGGARDRFADRRLSDNTTSTAKANETAAIANERAASLEKEAAAARLELEQIKERQRPRSITPEQREAFIQLLSPIEKGKVTFKVNAGDNEALDFAVAIQEMVKSAGCEVIGEMLRFISTGRAMSGIELKIKNKAAPPVHASNIQKAFEAIGIACPASGEAANDPLPEDTVAIYVAGKY